MKEEFAYMLRHARLEKGWTQSRLALIAGVSLPAIQSYESTRRSQLPGFENLAKLAAVFAWEFPLSMAATCIEHRPVYLRSEDRVILVPA